MMPFSRLLRTCTAAAAVLWTVAACAPAAPLHGVTIDDPQTAPALVLTGADGKVFDLSKSRGRTVLVYFGYTHCPDACPTMLSDWAKVRREMGVSADRVRFVFVAVDPERDTPQVAADYAKQFDANILGLAAGAAQVETIRQAWGFAVMKDETTDTKAGEYGVVHPGQAFVVFPNGKLGMIYPPGTKPADMAADLKGIK
jgi:protein SCO1/2